PSLPCSPESILFGVVRGLIVYSLTTTVFAERKKRTPQRQLCVMEKAIASGARQVAPGKGASQSSQRFDASVKRSKDRSRSQTRTRQNTESDQPLYEQFGDIHRFCRRRGSLDASCVRGATADAFRYTHARAQLRRSHSAERSARLDEAARSPAESCRLAARQGQRRSNSHVD